MTEVSQLEIPQTEIEGPFNLEETLLSAQTSEPAWIRDGSYFTDVEIFDRTPVKYSVSQAGTVDEFRIRVSLASASINDSISSQLKAHVITVLGLKDHLEEFYREFSDTREPLNSTFARLRGLRLMRATNLFESLIFSILSQNNSVQLMNRRARLLMQHYGTRVSLPNGSTYHMFPTAETLAKCTPRQLRSTTMMGYRAKSVVEVSRMVHRGEIRLEELIDCSYEKAIERILSLHGVGPKVADCFMLYGLGKKEAAPVDIWIHRIVSKLYFSGGKVTKRIAAKFLREHFGDWAGYAQLYLFDYARRGLVGQPIKLH